MHCCCHKHEALARSGRSSEAYVLAAERSGNRFGLMRVEATREGASENLPDLRVKLVWRFCIFGFASWELKHAMHGQA